MNRRNKITGLLNFIGQVFRDNLQKVFTMVSPKIKVDDQKCKPHHNRIKAHYNNSLPKARQAHDPNTMIHYRLYHKKCLYRHDRYRMCRPFLGTF
jgi:hypothetical protein